MEVHNVSVIGSGQMGNGIAHVFALAGFDVVLLDVDQVRVDNALTHIEKNLARQAKKGVIEEQAAKDALGRLRGTIDPETAAMADLVVEAVPEILDLKVRIFEQFDGACSGSTILASNTSSLPITKLAAATKRPDRVIGMHFMNPVPVMQLVEIVRGLETSDETYDTIHALTKKLGKTPAAAMDYPGFVSNRVLMPMINEAIFTLYEGVAKKEDIDTVMKLGMNHPMGPLKLADFIGLDTCLYILEVLHDGFGDPKYRPCPLLRKMVEAGRLGKKSGQGFYDWKS